MGESTDTEMRLCVGKEADPDPIVETIKLVQKTCRDKDVVKAHLDALVDSLRGKVVGSGSHRESELLRKVVFPVPFLACQSSELYSELSERALGARQALPI